MTITPATRDNLNIQDYTLTNYKQTSIDRFSSMPVDKTEISSVYLEVLEILKDPHTQISGSREAPQVEFIIPAPCLSQYTYTYGPWNADLYISADCIFQRNQDTIIMSLYSDIVDHGKVILPESIIASDTLLHVCKHHRVDLSHQIIQNYMLL